MMTDSPETPDIAHPINSEELEPGMLYAVLSYRGELATWNWGFYVPDPAVSPVGAKGTVFHVIEDTAGLWKFEVDIKEMLSSQETIAFIRLSDLSFLGAYADVVGKDSLLPMFRTVVPPLQPSTDFSSRTWFLDTICVLHDCGVVHCEDLWPLEREIRRCAFTAMDRYLENKGTISI